MEVLGTVSSVFAVVSLAGQLSSNIQNILEFWDSVKDAPAEIEQIKSQLQVLSMLLRSIEVEEGANESKLPYLGTDCLDICFGSVAKLQKFSTELNQGLNKSGVRRRWTCLNKAMRDMKLKSYWEEIERAKTLLILYQGLRNSQRNESVLSAISGLTRSHREESRIVSTGSMISTDAHSTGRVGLKKGSLTSTTYEFHLSFGTIRIRASTYYTSLRGNSTLPGTGLIKRKSHKHVKFSFMPSYLLRSVLEWTLTRGYSPWSLTLNTFNKCPDWSPIFKHTISGNIPAIRKLIEDGQASPNDINSEGMTPLHYAAMFHNFELCQMLIDIGAAAKAVTNRFASPLMMALDENYRTRSARTEEQKEMLDETSQLNTIRLLVEAGENDPMEADDIGFTPFLVGMSNPFNSGLIWLLKQDKYDLNLHYKTPTGHTAAAYVSVRDDISADLLSPLIRSGIEPNAPCADFFYFRYGARLQGPTMLQYAIWVWYDKLLTAVGQNQLYQLPPYPLATIRTLLDHGANIHALSMSGHTILDGMLLNFIQFGGNPYNRSSLDRCKMIWKGIISDLGICRKAYFGRELEIHKGMAPHDLGLGLNMKLQFTQPDSETPPWFWSVFQGVEERNKNICKYSVTECHTWRAWQLKYAIPERPDYPRRSKFLSSPIEIIVLNHKCSASLEESPIEALSGPASSPSTKISTCQSTIRRTLNESKWRLVRLSKYRHECSVYVFLLFSFLGCGYLARIWITAGLYFFLKFMEEVIL